MPAVCTLPLGLSQKLHYVFKQQWVCHNIYVYPLRWLATLPAVSNSYTLINATNVYQVILQYWNHTHAHAVICTAMTVIYSFAITGNKNTFNFIA